MGRRRWVRVSVGFKGYTYREARDRPGEKFASAGVVVVDVEFRVHLE